MNRVLKAGKILKGGIKNKRIFRCFLFEFGIEEEKLMENIDDFNRGAGLILGKLYQNFPVPIFLKMDDLERFEDVSRDPTRKARRIAVYSSTVHFFQNEGFLRFHQSSGEGWDEVFSDVVLTSKGLSALSKTPNTLSLQDHGKAAGAILVDLGSDMLKKGSWEGIAAIVRMMLGG